MRKNSIQTQDQARTPVLGKVHIGLAAIAALAMLTFAGSAHAWSSTTGVLGDVTIEGTNFARVAVGTTPITAGRPASGCHNAAYTTHYGFDISTTRGKAMLTAAISALLAGRSVTVAGSDSCVNLGTVSLENATAITVFK